MSGAESLFGNALAHDLVADAPGVEGIDNRSRAPWRVRGEARVRQNLKEIRVYPMIEGIEQELPMTALTSLALLVLVIANGAMYASTMEELAGHTASGLSRG
jgi:hypothetical protein